VGHFFLRDSHLICFTKLKQNSHFVKFYFVKLYLWGCLSFRTWDYKYSLQYPKVNYFKINSNNLYKKVLIFIFFMSFRVK
jgi:hypothetical protein